MLKVGDLLYCVSKASSTLKVIEAELICIIPLSCRFIGRTYFEYVLDLQGLSLYLHGYTYKVLVKSKETAVHDLEATGFVFTTKAKAIKYRMQLLQNRIACLQGALEEAQADLDNLIGVIYE